MDAQYPLGVNLHTLQYLGSNGRPYGAPLPGFLPQHHPNAPAGLQTLPPLPAPRGTPGHAHGLFSNSSQLLPPAYAVPPGPPYPPALAPYHPAAPASPAPLSLLRPMPAGGMQGASTSYEHLRMGPAPISNLPPDDDPAGAHGRRGILASATAALASAGGPAAPEKDPDGKFPCPHCNKTYLHAKHLKRHMLRRRCRAPAVPAGRVTDARV
jgi:hypothetical protein